MRLLTTLLNRFLYGDPEDQRPVDDRLLDHLRKGQSSATYAAFCLHLAPGVVLATLRRLRKAGRVREADKQPVTARHPRLKPRFVNYELDPEAPYRNASLEALQMMIVNGDRATRKGALAEISKRERA